MILLLKVVFKDVDLSKKVGIAQEGTLLLKLNAPQSAETENCEAPKPVMTSPQTMHLAARQIA